MLLAKSLLLLCSAVAVMARQSSAAVASGAIFVGVDTTKPDATPLDIFKDPINHATAISSIVAFSARKNGFTPSVVPAKSLVGPMGNFMKHLASFPGFFLEMNEQRPVHLTGSLIQLERAVREASLHHKALIGRSMRDLVPGYIPDETIDHWVLSLVVMDVPSDSAYARLFLIYLTMDIKTDEAGTAIIPEQRAMVNWSILRVNRSFLTAYADSMVDIVPITKVRDTIDLLTSPKDITGENIFAAPACRTML
ncbi:hypothetical protein DFQ27_003285 [Actinomortierella ambigua]|uniref:Uncharacterized protein n=1 Tax=Actinomortierella ambigua TaxID=1343610 RepID=A0A9P6U517_9FUNG|nr:hypothetical protein DFQ27_003285 [Actinomortierella ambigua]